MKRIIEIAAVLTVVFLSGCKKADPQSGVSGILLDKNEMTMVVGENVRLAATLIPENDSETVTWVSSDESVATVDADGNISAVAEGKAYVTAANGPYSASCLVDVLGLPEAGDYYFSDGTWSGELEKGKTPIAVVFWSGNPQKDDAALAREQPQCRYGLAVSLADTMTVSGWQFRYEEPGSSVSAWIEQNVSDYVPIGVDINGGIEPDYMNCMHGYNNTKAIEVFNAAPENERWRVDAVALLGWYEDVWPAPESSSGWYLPSIKELCLMVAGEYDVYDALNYEVGVADVAASLNEKIEQIPDAMPLYSSYWSSSEFGVDYACYYTCYPGFGSDNAMAVSKNAAWDIRAILAF